jgi:hypothetical protein
MRTDGMAEDEKLRDAPGKLPMSNQRAHRGYTRPPATAPSWKIGRNIAMTMPPTTTPRKHDQDRLDQRSERRDRRIALHVVEIGDLVHHAVDVAGRLTRLHHVLHHRREERIGREHFGNLAALTDVLGDFFAGVSICTCRSPRRRSRGCADRHARTDQRRIGAAETGERDLVDQVAENRGLHEELSFDAAAVGRGRKLAQPQKAA